MSFYDLHSERELLLLVAESNELAFAVLMQRYHAPAFRVVMKLLGDRWVAEDVVQDVFLKVWLSRETLPGVDNFRGWLFTIATRKVYDQIRKHQRDNAHLQRWQQEFNITGNDGASAGDVAALVAAAVQRLSPKQREVFTYIKQEGYSRQETAAIMNISPETVKTHLEQAMRTIRAYCMRHLDIMPVSLLIALVVKQSC